MMFSAYGFSVQPFSSDGQDVRAYFDMTFDLSAALTLVLYVSNATGYATRPTDSLPNQPFRGVLQKFAFQRSILGGDIGQFTTGSGQLVIANADAFYDFLPQTYAIDGRAINIYLGRRDGSYDAAFPLARLTAKDWNIDTDSITIDLVDNSYKLEVPMQTNVYGGTGGSDGGADLAGKRKPLSFGNPRNISPVFVNPSLLIYQCHDGSMQSVDAVYDRGASLTPGANYATYALLAAASVSAGTFATCKAQGYIKLGSAASGTVTADVKGENTSSFLTTTADIVKWALLNRTTLTSSSLDITSFANLNVAQGAPIDYFLGPDDDLTVAAFIQALMGGIGGWGGHKLDGTFEVRIFEAPSGTAVASFTRDDMLDPDIKREALPSAYVPPPYRWRVPYARAWTQQTDLAGSVSATQKAFVAEPYRLAEAVSATIQTDHPFAQDRDPIGAWFTNQSDAQAEASRRIDLFQTTRVIYRALVPRRGLRRDMGDIIQVTHPRFDLVFGRLMTVVETTINIDFTANAIDAVELAAYG